jgi:hypothetical protein
MLTKISKKIALVVFAVVLTGCANSDFSHNYLMRGQIVSASSDNIIVCVGFDDGAKVGQELNVYRFFETNFSGEGDEFYEKRSVGKIKVEKVIDGHFAKATILKGKIKKTDMVELNR